MSRSLHDLDQSLAKESSLRSTLLTTLISLNGAIKQCNAGEIVVERDRIREHLESLESHRTLRDTAILAVAKEFGEDARPVTLKSIEPHLPGGWGNRFASHRSSLARLAQETEEINRENQVLLKGGLEIVSQLVNSFLTEESKSTTYGREGSRIIPQRNNGLLDTRA